MILDAYERKKKENTLPYGLMYLTPAKIKEVCELKCTQNVSKQDEKTIREFCGDLNETKTILAVVQRCETDKFRPLVNFIRGKSEKPDEKHIELLAWLIDFPGRPFKHGKNYAAGNIALPETDAPEQTSEILLTEVPGPKPEKPEISETPSPLSGTENPVGKEKTKSKPSKRLALAAILSLVLGTTATWWWKESSQPLDLSGGCMYWKEDHYELAACNEKVENARIIALDTMKLKYFRKITRPDTITYQSLGKVWYSKINGKIEYYTSAGEHPETFGRKLKPISIYMINKYILSNSTSN